MFSGGLLQSSAIGRRETCALASITGALFWRLFYDVYMQHTQLKAVFKTPFTLP
jgi:hypothetical protein